MHILYFFFFIREMRRLKCLNLFPEISSLTPFLERTPQLRMQTLHLTHTSSPLQNSQDRIVGQFAHNLRQNALFSALRTASWMYETVLLPPPHHTLLISWGIFRFQWGRGREDYESLVRYAVCKAQSTNCKIKKCLYLKSLCALSTYNGKISIDENDKARDCLHF